MSPSSLPSGKIAAACAGGRTETVWVVSVYVRRRSLTCTMDAPEKRISAKSEAKRS